MRICLLCDAQSIHFQRWARHLQMRGHTVKVYSQQYESIQGVEVAKLGLPRAPFPLFKSAKKFLKALYRIERGRHIRKELRAFRPQIIHAHFLTDSGWISSWTGFHPLILTAHGSDVLVHPECSRIDKLVARFCLHKADVVTMVARHMRSKLRQLGCAPKKLTYLPNFVDTDLFNILGRKERNYKKKLSKPVIVSARSLKPIYNVKMLIEAIPRVIRETSDVKFLIIGEGSEKQALVARAEQLQIGHHLDFLPHQPHERLAKIFQQADIYVSTSRSDGLCVSLLEAMASGLYPIVTDIPGNREVIDDDINGSLIPVNDQAALGEKIVEMVRKPQRFPTILKRNFDLIRSRYDEKNIMAEAEQLYNNLV